LSRFRNVGEEVVYRGSLISVAQGVFADPAGGEFRRDVVHHPGAVSVVPVIDGGASALLVRQYRAAVDRELLEIPAGKRDVEGEPVEVTARRELEEEIGMRAGRLEQLAEFYNSPGFCDEHSFVFMARDLEPCTSSAQGIEEQHMSVERVSLDEVPALIADGTLIDAKSIIGLLLAINALAG
jgi:8-oxo-dGTP pyrophosphatase MutT (NUDIX family)